MDTLIRALTADPAPAVVPAAYQPAAKAKLERDRKSYQAFRAVDQAGHDRAYEQRVTAEVDGWAEEVRLFGVDIAELEPEAAGALKAAREAEDRAREAGEYARTRRLEYERVKGESNVSAQDETDALLRADAAEETAHQRREAAAGAAEVSRKADEALAESREGLAQAERELERTRARAKVPGGAAPISDVTVRACTSYMQRDEVWDQLSDRDKFRVRQAGQPRDMMSGAQFWAEFRENSAGRAEAV